MNSAKRHVNFLLSKLYGEADVRDESDDM